MFNTISKNLREHPYAQCHVRIDEKTGGIDFISYSTRVISIRFEGEQRQVECTGTYSPTTRKQIGWFLREYARDLSYSMMKAIAGEGFVTI